MRRGTPRRSEQNQSFDEEIGKIPEQLPEMIGLWRPRVACSRGFQETEHLTAWSIIARLTDSRAKKIAGRAICNGPD
jgi:hypothetical protein